jgi:N-acyl amino acid synthase of PEP-CTERM/exosortase system
LTGHVITIVLTALTLLNSFRSQLGIILEKNRLSLTENFHKYFSVDLATTPEQMRSVFNIRYRVYCEELKLEPIDDFPDQMEFDEFDDHSHHCLITHRRTGLPAGCVRLITTSDDMYADPLPLERYCLDSLSLESATRLNQDREAVCEISRLAVDVLFRRRFGETANQLGKFGAMDCCHQELRAFSLIAVAGFMAGAALSELTGRFNIFAMMDPMLPKLLRRSGILFEKAGENIDYHGLRAPYFITTQTIHDHMRPELQEFYYDIFRGFEAKYKGLRKLC